MIQAASPAPSPTPEGTHDSVAAAVTTWSAELRLVRFCDQVLGRAVGTRIARGSAVVLAVGFGAAAAGAEGHAHDRHPAALALTVRAVSVLSVAVGALVTWTAAASFARRYEETGLADLALSRGFSRQDLRRAHALATGARIFRLVTFPALFIAALALGAAGGGVAPTSYVLLLLAIVAHGAVLGVVAHALMRMASMASEGRERLALVVAWLGPELARAIWPSAPSLSAFFAWLVAGLGTVAGL